MTDYSSALAQFEEAFDAVDVTTESGEFKRPWLDGESFEAEITACRVGPSPWDRDGMWLYIAFADGNKKDDYYRSLQPGNDSALNGLKKTLLGLGYDGRLSELPDRTGEIIGRRISMRYKITKGDNKDYHNYYFNKVVESTPAEEIAF